MFNRATLIQERRLSAGSHGDMADMATLCHEQSIRVAVAVATAPEKWAGRQLKNEAGEVICVDCHEVIPAKRLEAMPFATRCTSCKEANEKARS